jgi:hypothetical protein
MFVLYEGFVGRDELVEATGSPGIATQLGLMKLSEDTCIVAPQPVLSSAVISDVSIGKLNVTMMFSVTGIHRLLLDGENDETAAAPVSTT